jgi:hypothetical protein
VAERAVALGLANEPLYRLGSNLARRFQQPWTQQGQLNLPALLSPGQGRKLPALAKRSFREMWATGELEELQ